MSKILLEYGFVMLALTALLGGCADSELDTRDEALMQQVAPTWTRSVEVPVTLREKGTATVRVTNLSERATPGNGPTALAIHGLAETAVTFTPLAGALVGTVDVSIKRVLGLDLVGHGSSTLPTGVTFGDLTIDDNVDVIAQVIEGLKKQNLAPDVIIGHSTGGLAIQALQERLLASGSSLAKIGVKRAVLLAPVPAHGRPWTQPTGGNTSAFIRQDAVLGSYLDLPSGVFLSQSFTTTKGALATNAITVGQINERYYIGREPLATLLQLLEAPVTRSDGTPASLARPSVRAGAFAADLGTRLTVVSFSEDTLVPAANLPDLAEYLAGDAKAHVAVVNANAVHGSFISDPWTVLAALRSTGI